MYDLNEIMFFKNKFTISANSSNEDLLWKIVCHVRKWIAVKCKKRKIKIAEDAPRWTKIKFGGRISSMESMLGNVYIESEYYKNEGGLEFWACRITEKYQPEAGYALRRWITEIGYEQLNKDEAVFSCVVSYSDTPGFIGYYAPPPIFSVHSIVLHIINDGSITCFCGKDILRTGAKKLLPGEWPAFWENLTESKRELPYIYISPKLDGKEEGNCQLLIDPNNLAYKLSGNALVFYSDQIGFSEEMRYLSDRSYACYGGNVRIYFPGIDMNDEENSYKHRYLPSSYIEKEGEDVIIQIFEKALVQNVSFYESFFSIDECRRKKEELNRHNQLIMLQERHKEELDEIKDKKIEEAIMECERRTEAEEKNRLLEQQLKDIKREKYSLETQIESIRDCMRKGKELEAVAKARYEIKTMSDSPEDVMKYFSIVFCDRIAFTDEAYVSAKECKLSIEELWSAFYNLAVHMRDSYVSGDPNPEKEFKRQTGIDCGRSAGSETRKDSKLMRQFYVEYEGNVIDIQAHLKYKAKNQRIHFGYFEKTQKIIVGHCGKHLDISSTRKIK